MLEKIRSSSIHLKRKLALYVALVVTIIIVVVWFLTSSGRLYRTYVKVSESSVAFFEFLNENVERVYSDFKNKAPINEIKENIEQIKKGEMNNELKNSTTTDIEQTN